MADNNQPVQQFVIQRIFTKDMSFEAPRSAEIFLGTDNWKPELKVDLNTQSKKVMDDVYEVAVTVTVTATHRAKTSFLIEVQQAGLFLINGVEGEQL